MANLKLPKQYHPDFQLPNKKPVGDVEVDWSNIDTNGLQSFYILNDRNNAPVNLVDNKASLITNSAYTWNGEGWRQTSTSKTAASYFKIGTIPASGTIVIKLRIHSLYNYSSIFDTNNGVNNFESWVYSDGRVGARNASGSTTLIHSSVAAGELFEMVYSWVGGGSSQLYVNGVLSDSGSAISFSGDNIFLSSGNAGNDGGQSTFVYAKLYDRVLSANEVLRNFKNPYQILKPKNDQYYWTAGGAAPSGFQPAWAIHANKLINMVQY